MTGTTTQPWQEISPGTTITPVPIAASTGDGGIFLGGGLNSIVTDGSHTYGQPINSTELTAGNSNMLTGYPLPDSAGKNFGWAMSAKAGANTANVAVTIKLFKNGSALTSNITIPAGSTSLQTTTGLDTFAAGDLIYFQVTSDAGTGTVSAISISLELGGIGL